MISPTEKKQASSDLVFVKKKQGQYPQSGSLHHLQEEQIGLCLWPSLHGHQPCYHPSSQDVEEVETERLTTGELH